MQNEREIRHSLDSRMHSSAQIDQFFRHGLDGLVASWQAATRDGQLWQADAAAPAGCAQVRRATQTLAGWLPVVSRTHRRSWEAHG